jgi:hypothetical protein
MTELNIESSYDQLYQYMITTNKQKISYLKNKLNEICPDMNENHDESLNSLPNYLKYVLSLLIGSHPIIKKYLIQIVDILNYIHNLNVHPSIIKTVLINLIQSCYIDNLINTSDIDINSINQTPYDVDMAISYFDTQIDIVDRMYIKYEHMIGYNEINMLNYDKFNEHLYYVINNRSKIENVSDKFNILSTYISYIDHELFNEAVYLLEKKYDKADEIHNEIISKNKNIFDFSKELLNELDTVYDQIVDKLKHCYRHEIFRDIDIIDQFKIDKFKHIYFWIDFNAQIINYLIHKLLSKK